MAPLTGPHATPEGVSDTLPGGRSDATTAARPAVDPRAVRVSLAPASAAAAVDPMTVAPADATGDVTAAGRGASLRRLDPERAVLTRDGSPGERLLVLPLTASPGAGPARREVVVGGWRFEVDLEAASHAALRERAHRGREDRGHSGPTEVRAIIPGVVVSVSVAPGDEVVAGQQLLAVEAMKMQNELRAPRDGVIERVAIATGQTIEVGDVLLVIA